MGTTGLKMELKEKIVRILQTRKGTRPGNHNYGSRVYLLRDKRVSPETMLMFAKYCKEDIELSDPNILVEKAKLIDATEDKFVAQIVANNKPLGVVV